MPFTKIKTSGGSFKFNYTISTPSSTSAKSIQKGIPTILLLHPVYIASAIFHPQLMDPNLRRFNLVAIDARGHGETTGPLQKTVGPVDSAEDLYKIMMDLKLPPCHIIACSMGATQALELSAYHPNMVLSMALISPLPFTEPEDIAEGRMEIHQYWREGFANPKKPDHEALATAIRGALQLAFNNAESAQIGSILKHSIPQITRLYGAGLTDGHRIMTAEYFLQPRSHSPSELERITCPVLLIHCQGDIAYTYDHTNSICMALQDAGVNATISLIDDINIPHYGGFTHPHIINPLIHDFFVSNLEGSLPPVPTAVTSPFEASLRKTGWEDEDSDTEFV